jgi:hypothetical protein
MNELAARRRNSRISFDKENFMLRNYAFTRFVISFLVMGRAVTARAADGAAPSYPDWAAAVVPAYPHVLPSSGPIYPEFIWDRNDRPHADGGCVVQIARARRMVGKRGRKYLVCKERRGKNPDLSEFLR